MTDNTTKPLEPAPTTIDKDQLDAHRAMVLWLFLATVVLCLVFGGALWLVDRGADLGGSRPPILLVVVTAGALGGFVSCLRRLYAFEDIFPRKQYASLFKKLNIYLVAYSTIPPMIGMIAAAFVYVVFAAEMLKGPLFPAFHCSESGNGCKIFSDFLKSWAPAAPTDYAKAIVWGFVSGFSERFFVDILNQFGTKGQSKL